jgi:hypothetical protein
VIVRMIGDNSSNVWVHALALVKQAELPPVMKPPLRPPIVDQD